MANTSTVNGGTVLTVPAGSNWIGSVILSASVALAPGGAGVGATPSITVSGGGGNYADGDTLAAVSLTLAAVGVTSLVGVSTAETVSTGQINVQARATPVKLILNMPAGVNAVGVAAGAMQ